MGQDSTTERGEKETRDVKQSNTAGLVSTKTSRQTTGQATPPEVLLGILTQAAADINTSAECHERGITATFKAIGDVVVIIVRGSEIGPGNILVPRTLGSATNVEGK